MLKLKEFDIQYDKSFSTVIESEIKEQVCQGGGEKKRHGERHESWSDNLRRRRDWRQNVRHQIEKALTHIYLFIILIVLLQNALLIVLK